MERCGYRHAQARVAPASAEVGRNFICARRYSGCCENAHVPVSERRHRERVSGRGRGHVRAEAPKHCAVYGCVPHAIPRGAAAASSERGCSCRAGVHVCRRLHVATAFCDCHGARVPGVALGGHTGAARAVRGARLRAAARVACTHACKHTGLSGRCSSRWPGTRRAGWHSCMAPGRRFCTVI